MKFTTEQFRALMNACDHRAQALKPLAEKSRAAAREMEVLEDLAHSFGCSLSMIADLEAQEEEALAAESGLS